MKIRFFVLLPAFWLVVQLTNINAQTSLTDESGKLIPIHVPSLSEIAVLPEEQISYTLACLSASKEFYPDMNETTVFLALRKMAGQIQFLTQKMNLTQPHDKIGLMNTYFFRPGWWNEEMILTYDLDDLEAKKQDNRFFYGYLKTRKGSCITMHMMYLVIGELLSYPIYPVRSAKHFFDRWIEKGFELQNIEATNGGGFISDKRYIQDAGIPQKALDNGVYMRTLSKKEYVACLLAISATHYADMNNLDKAYQYLKLAIELDPTMSTAYWNMGEVYFRKAQEIENQLRGAMDTLKKEMQAQKEEVYALYGIQPPNHSQQLMLPSPSPIQHRNTLAPPTSFGFFDPLNPESVKNHQSRTQRMNQYLIEQSLKPHSSLPRSPDPKQEIWQDLNPLSSSRQEDLRIDLQEIEREYQKKFNILLAQYLPEGDRLYEISIQYRQKAKQLGIVLKFPEEFFIKQSESIEKFKLTGGY